VSTLILFDRTFNGLITRVEIWKQILSEQQLLGSYRDCRKQNGDIFSWSHMSNEISIDTNKLKSSSFCTGNKTLTCKFNRFYLLQRQVVRNQHRFQVESIMSTITKSVHQLNMNATMVMK